MKVISSSNSLNFSGVLDENTSKTELASALDSLRMRGVVEPVAVNFSKVMYANSTGIITWLQFLHKSQAALKYLDAPLWLVDHFNLLRGFFDSAATSKPCRRLMPRQKLKRLGLIFSPSAAIYQY